MPRLSRLALLAALVPSVLAPPALAQDPAPAPGPAQTLALAFLPPEVAPQDLCAPARTGEDDLDLGQGDDEDEARLMLRYLRRDLRDLQAEDADRWFEFILALIDWQATLDPDFAGASAQLARIALHVDAGRLDQLREAGLIERLRADPLDNAQRMALAQYYLSGIGVDADVPYAHDLIREAAYGGNVDALMTAARMALRGEPLPGWQAPLDLTVTLAFGGMLGPVDAGVCDRALRIAQAYDGGDVVARDPEVALAWHRFAADLGGAEAAWRVVEYHLAAPAGRKDDAEMRHYLALAADRGFGLDAAQAEGVRAAGADAETVLAMLGPNLGAAGDRPGARPSISPYLRLAVSLDAEDSEGDGPRLRYLRVVVGLPAAPGFMFRRLAEEVLIEDGRWAGEAEAMTILEEAASRGDGEAMRLLGRMTLRGRDDPAEVERAASLLMEAAEVHGVAQAMDDLDALFRCQVPDAPRLAEAAPWARAYDASGAESVSAAPTDLVALDPFREPEALARLQTQALGGDVTALAGFVERVQLDPLASEDAHRLWAGRLQRSDKALELFAELEFTLAVTPSERDLAIELFRRVHLNNGVTSALDLAVALVEQDGRVPAVADEVVRLLEQASYRGEGASIRLLARLTGDEAGTFARFAATIEERGDFLSLMFAIPHVGALAADDYLDRAVSLMICGTKDVDELGDAATVLGDAALSDHWRRVGLAVEGGHVLARLGLSRRQMEGWRRGPAPGPVEVLERGLSDGEALDEDLYALTADPDLPSYDPEAAAGHLAALLSRGEAAEEAWALGRVRDAAPEVRAAVEARVDVAGLALRAAQRGDARAQFDLALLLRAEARGAGDLRDSARWLLLAAEAGDAAAMAEMGRVLAQGIGVAHDRAAALGWLDRAGRAGDAEAAELARLLRLGDAS